MNDNTRNQHGVKDSVKTYLNIKGERFEQWTDFTGIEECKSEYPEYNFIARKQKEGFTRVYRQIEQ